MSKPAIPIFRPKLPSAEQLLPYLRELDSSRYYANSGPLCRRLESRLAGHFGAAEGAVALCANGTLGLAVALMAQEAEPGTLCLLPAWTHIATVQAIRLAGLIPYFADVDPETWALNAESVPATIREAPGRVGAIIVVCSFGRPIDCAAWDQLRATAGLPVVIDAAAAFDTLIPTVTPAVVSLHATKLFGIGEGGLVLSTDPEISEAVRLRLNLGQRGRLEEVPGINAKLSEYHAAAGNASLDEWESVRAEWMRIAALYRQGFSSARQICLQPGFGESWVSSSLVIDTGLPDTGAFEAKLGAAGIETRRWWEYGAHAHPTTLTALHTPLPVTTRLAGSTIALPIYRELGEAEVERVVECSLAAAEAP